MLISRVNVIIVLRRGLPRDGCHIMKSRWTLRGAQVSGMVRTGCDICIVLDVLLSKTLRGMRSILWLTL